MQKGILLKIASAFAFMLMSVMVKLSNDRFPTSEIVLFRSFFSLVVLVIWLAVLREFPGALVTLRPLGHLGRGLAGSLGMFSSFAVLSFLPLPDATAFSYAAPLMVVVFAALFLKERVRIYRWSAVGVGFAGVIVMLWEHLGSPISGTSSDAAAKASTGVAIALTAAFFAAIATIQTRRLTVSERTGAIVFYFSLITTGAGAAILAAAALWHADWPGASLVLPQAFIQPGWREMAALASIGVVGGLGQILMTESFRHADASIIACFDYSSMLWALVFGLAVFGEAPSALVLAGAAIVASAGLFVIWRERRLGLQAVADRGI